MLMMIMLTRKKIVVGILIMLVVVRVAKKLSTNLDIHRTEIV